MKKIFLLITMLALMPFVAINAQEEGRQRAMTTIVADGLAQLPADNAEVYNSVMAELAATGSEGVQMIADMLQIAKEGVNNSPMEYALSGVATYVTKADDELRAGVREGLKAAFASEQAPVLKAYLMQTLEICATKEDVEFFAEQLNDEYLKEYAVHALAKIDTSGAFIWEIFQRAYGINIDKSVLSHVASYQHIPGAEGFLILWLKEAQDDNERAQIYHALASCGGAKAEKVLAAAAKGVGYNFENTDAYGSYVTLLNRLVVDNPILAASGAKKLMKVEKNNVRLQGLDLMARLNGKDVLPLILKGLKDESRDYRYGALLTANYFADEEVYAAIAAALPKVSDDAKVDVLNYLGASHAESQIASVASHISSDCDCVAVAAIEAAGRIGGEEALQAIMAEVATESEGEVYDAAVATLLAFNGKIDDAVVAALEGNEESQAAALQILQKRRITKAADKVLAMANAGCEAAVKALPTVATEHNFDSLCDMLLAGKCDKSAVSQAIIKSLKELPAAEQVERIERQMAKTDKVHMFYPILAATGAKEAIAPIVEGYNNGNVENLAFASLCTINDDSLIDQMYKIAQENEALKEQAVARYIALVKASARFNGEQKFARYRAALELNPSVANKNKALRALSPTQTYQGMMLAAEYMDDEATAQAAANTVLEIATKHPEFFSAELKALLEKVAATLNDGDAVYKRKDIEKFISENKAQEGRSVVAVLSAEEQAEGFEMLFDGVNMDKWQGNTAAYQPINGYMYVTASYGSTGNLYTLKEYDDFVLRFEFCFGKEGVNNGVGIRADMGKDAAYYGMEIQLLHHDAPIYKNLLAHQVHGSVYGIIPAKRIKWEGIGDWHQEEIRVKGDHITVTVDGVVIVDGNIRKACKGHNVAPDGGRHNPYTVDGYNHPGLFNKKGYICFCGHGEGMKLRNVRVKEL